MGTTSMLPTAAVCPLHSGKTNRHCGIAVALRRICHDGFLCPGLSHFREAFAFLYCEHRCDTILHKVVEPTSTLMATW